MDQPLRYCFDRSDKIVNSADFVNIFKNKKIVRKQGRFLMFASPNGLEQPKLGLSVSRKAVAKAVNRNLIKRIVRESFRQAKHNLPWYDFVLVVRVSRQFAHQHSITNQDILNSIESIWSYFLVKNTNVTVDQAV